MRPPEGHAGASLPAQRVAILLHGRIGIWKTKASHIDDAKVVWMSNAPQVWKQAPATMDKIDLPGSPHSTLAGFAAFGRGSLQQHVVLPNQQMGIAIDFFLHSWHVEIGKQLDAMYQPVASRHDKVQPQLNAVRSQHLSLKIVLGLAREYAATKSGTGSGSGSSTSSSEGVGVGGSSSRRIGRSLSTGGGGRRVGGGMKQAAAAGAGAATVPSYYDLYMVTRYDVLFFTTLQLAPLTSSPLWLPHWCHRYPLTAESGMLVRAACGNWPGHGEGYLVHPATTVGVFPPVRGKLAREADFDYAYLDWWFVASPAVAHTFGEVYDQYEVYRQALHRVSPNLPKWTHFYWGHHINKRLRMRRSVRFVMYEGVDFRLARHWAFGTHCVHFLGGGGGAAGNGRGHRGADVDDASSTVHARPSSPLATLSSVGVDLGIYFRRTSARHVGRHSGSSLGGSSLGGSSLGGGAAQPPFLPNGTLRPGAQLARQCPLDTRVRLYCPWLSPVCPAATRETVLEVEAAARMALVASTRLPPWDLFGDGHQIEQARQEVTLRRRASGASSESALNRTRMAGRWALT